MNIYDPQWMTHTDCGQPLTCPVVPLEFKSELIYYFASVPAIAISKRHNVFGMSVCTYINTILMKAISKKHL